MNPTKRHPSRALKYLEVYEGWKADHDEAMQCYDLEEWLHEGLCVFEIVTGDDQASRTGVYFGCLTPEQAEQHARELYGRWLEIARSALPGIDHCEAKFGSVKRADEFRATIEKAESVLRGRAPQKPAMAPGAQYQELDADETAQLENLLKAPRGAPGTLTREPKLVPKADPSLLR